MNTNPASAQSSGDAEFIKYASEPADAKTFQNLLEIITDTNIAEQVVVATAWTPIIAQWAQGWTNALLGALLESNIELQGFLAQLLRRIWVTMLGTSPRVVGTYVYPGLRVKGKQKSSAPGGLTGDLHELLDCAHPGIRQSDSFKDPWGDHFHPPAGKSWAPSSAHVHMSSQNTSVLRDIIIAAKNEGGDINIVIMRAIPHFQQGLTGIGQSGETRAFLACYLTSLYSPTPNAMKFSVSPECGRAMTAIMQMPDEDQSYVYAIIFPVITSLLPSDTPPLATSWHSNPALPLWYFVINFAHRTPRYRTVGLTDLFKAALGRLHKSKDSFPMLAVPSDPSSLSSTSHHVSLATVIAWLAETLLIIRLKQHVARATGQVALPVSNPRPRTREVAWIDTTTISDVDAHIDSLRSFGLDELWQELSPDFRKATTEAIVQGSPQEYAGNLKTVCKENLETYLSTNTPEEMKNKITVLWAKFVALGGQYTEEFCSLALGLDNVSAKAVFNALIRLFNPFPTDQELGQMRTLQQIYDKAAYEGPKDMPPHLVHRFIQILTPLVRYHTILAETLAECGILTLTTAIRDGRYNYPETDSPLPEETRKGIRQHICDDMQNALSERMYVAAQAKLLRENPGEMYTHQPSQTRRPIRRRPSWMATGG